MLDELEELEEDGLPPILGEHDNDLEAEVPKEGIIDDDLEAEVPKEGIIDDDLEAGVPKEGIIDDDLEAEVQKEGIIDDDIEEEVPKAGVMDAPEKETEPPSDLAEQEKPQGPGTRQQETPGGMVDVPLRKSRRVRRLTRKAEQIQYEKQLALSADYAEIEPETFEEAVNDPVHGAAWREAIKSEFRSEERR